MRIIHDIDGETQVSATGEPHAKHISERATGFRVKILITSMRLGREEVIHIHGSAKFVREALQTALEQIDIVGDAFVREGAIEPNWSGKSALKVAEEK